MLMPTAEMKEAPKPYFPSSSHFSRGGAKTHVLKDALCRGFLSFLMDIDGGVHFHFPLATYQVLDQILSLSLSLSTYSPYSLPPYTSETSNSRLGLIPISLQENQLHGNGIVAELIGSHYFLFNCLPFLKVCSSCYTA